MVQIDDVDSVRGQRVVGDDVHLLLSFESSRPPTLISTSDSLEIAHYLTLLPMHRPQGIYGGYRTTARFRRPLSPSCSPRRLPLLFLRCPAMRPSPPLHPPHPRHEDALLAGDVFHDDFVLSGGSDDPLALLQALVRLAGVPPPACAPAGSSSSDAFRRASPARSV
ncbi:hypothetical protein AAT19DRAFT_12568 [Rhodotorula toruloides]|uniref:Uncharacterized protein n=1 Tax=Rhodotorula toruloides TaxID=5286 RepID=A0A2T0AGP0_RHOTO|nr:hypothetical protein AAT19DRAFT_12568 [Rhodotorula toruloides]